MQSSAYFFSAKNTVIRIWKLVNPTEVDLKSSEHAEKMQIFRNDVITIKRVCNTNLFSYSHLNANSTNHRNLNLEKASMEDPKANLS